MINLRRKVKVEDQKQLNVLIITLKVLCFPWCCFFLSTRGKQVTFFATIHKQSQDHQLLDFPARCTLHAARCVRFRCVLCDLFTAVVCAPYNTFSLLDVMTFVCAAESEVNQDSQTVCH